MGSKSNLRQLPVEFLWDGLVLKDDLYNYDGKVLLLAKGETVIRSKLQKLMNFYGEDKSVMINETSYLEIMSSNYIPVDIRQKVIEERTGYSKLHKGIGAYFHNPNRDAWLNEEKMGSLSHEVYTGIKNVDPLAIFECIDFPRPLDEDLQRHSLNVGFLNGFQAERLNLSPDEVKTFILAGLLHDIGKTMIPQEILQANRKLTDDEMKIVRMHPVYSYSLLDGKFDSYIMSAARHHHEKLDGTGYPDGISGDLINLCSRVTAISDIYDAMVSVRSYKDARFPLNVLAMFYNGEFSGLDTILLLDFIKSMCKKFINKRVLMSDGHMGVVRFIPFNDVACPVVSVGKFIGQTTDSWFCKSMVANV